MTESVQSISLVAAFSAGLLSFVSPCVLPLVPSYVSYITGLSIEQLTDVSERSRFRKAIIINSLLFIAGFSSVFVAFGASASFLGQVLFAYQEHLRRFGGNGGGSSKKYNLTFSLNAQNLFNNVNAGSPIGNLSSTLFGTSNSIGGGFGFGPMGATSSSAAFNRKIEAQIRFSF